MIFSPEMLAYLADHCSEEPLHLQQLRRETHMKVLYPRMLSGPHQGRMLSLISHLLQPQRILEVGTYTGYSAICMAEGMAPEGELITLELNPELDFLIFPYLEKAGVRDKVSVRFGPAADSLKALQGPFDLMFLDANKGQYPEYLELMFPLLTPGGLLIADNTLWDGKVLDESVQDKETIGIREFNQAAVQLAGADCVMVPLRDGMTLIRKHR
ncbi:MAG: O-methyltransferase [Bacteroidota bacterium]